MVGQHSAPGSQKSSRFLRRVKWCEAIGHNVIGILNLFGAVTSEPLKIKSRFLLLWAGYALGIWFRFQPFGYSYVSMYLQRCFSKVLLPVFLRKSFFCPGFVQGLSWVYPYCLFCVLTMSLWWPSYVLRLSSSLKIFLMLSLPWPFFGWKAFGKTCIGVKEGYLWSSSRLFIISWWGRTSWVCHKSFIRPSVQISRAQKGHCTVSTSPLFFLSSCNFDYDLPIVLGEGSYCDYK